MKVQRDQKRARRGSSVAPYMWIWGALIALSVALAGCCSCPARGARVGAPPSLEEIRARALDARRRAWLLRQLDPRTLRAMNQCMFALDFFTIKGNRADPFPEIERFERELRPPEIISEARLEALLEGMRGRAVELSTMPMDPYERVTAALGPAITSLQSELSCVDLIEGSSDRRTVAAFLVEEYFRSDHYHQHNFTHMIFQWLIEAGDRYRPWSLPVIESVFRDAYHDFYEYRSSIEAAKPIVGPHFDQWYRDVRGVSQGWENFSEAMPWNW